MEENMVVTDSLTCNAVSTAEVKSMQRPAVGEGGRDRRICEDLDGNSTGLFCYKSVIAAYARRD